MPPALRDRIAADIRAAADDTIEDRPDQTGQTPNIGGPEEFAQSIEAQRVTAPAWPRCSVSNRCNKRMPNRGGCDGLQVRSIFALLFGLLALRASGGPAAAADWPTRPVKFILTLGPGSGTDIGARLFADRLSKRWGQPVIVENRPGGDGIVAINAFVCRA